MDLTRRSIPVYALLAAVWVLVLGWQIEEHHRVNEAARGDLRNRARDIGRTVGAFIRGLRFFDIVTRERLDPVLNELVGVHTNELLQSSQVLSIVLLNATNATVASAGPPIDISQEDLQQEGERWGRRSVTLINPVDLGAILTSEGVTNPTVVLPRRGDFTNSSPDNFRGRERRREPRPPEANGTNFVQMSPPPPEGGPGEGQTNAGTLPSQPTERFGRDRGPGDGPPRMRRPFWLRGRDDAEIQAMMAQGALHGLVLAMSTEPLRAASVRDLWLRSIIVFLATVSVFGSGLAWSNLAKSSELQIRLVRASELNTHLKEMNLAAAGLAHETRNPLNIIRGLAHMISRRDDAPKEVRDKSCDILGETDKVTAQLNEFINYSRPREVRRTPLALNAVVNEVVRTLNYDIEEKRIKLQVKGESLTIEADEQMLRQALFNLLLNAVQAVNGAGEIQVAAERRSASEAMLEIRDNGPGVAPENRAEIFKPYFTTQKTGTGLGLAVVQQIVLAHGWEIQCLPNEPQGAVFRITHLKLAS